LGDGYSLKDATPYNVLFRGSKPVFIDVLSSNAAFQETDLETERAVLQDFLLPLLAYKYWGFGPPMCLPNIVTASSRRCVPVLRPIRKFLPPFLTQVSLPTWLLAQRWQESHLSRPRFSRITSRQNSSWIRCLNRLRRSLQRVVPESGRHTVWSDYQDSCSYTDANFAAKEEFVSTALAEFKPGRVLDIGCNTGHSVTWRPAPVRRSWRLTAISVCRRALAAGVGSKPGDTPAGRGFVSSEPAEGWRNRECASFLERATGAFDMGLMLAVLHHLLVTERIPLDEVLDLAAELTTDLLIIEFVPPDDEMFQTSPADANIFMPTLPRQFRGGLPEAFSDCSLKQLDGATASCTCYEK